MNRFLLALLLLGSLLQTNAQPDYRLPLQKPEKYRDKELGAERTEDKKFTLPRRLFQGMITHYNYYYNAQKKIEGIVQKAKAGHRDDYTELLPFYNYSTLQTSADSVELDSILYKATAGIVLHDLRNSYIDNLYLLIGKAYFYWEKFDSAHRIFQFINYNFFPKAKNDYQIVVGSNNRSDKGILQIATKENKNIVHRAFSKPPSRNEALLWLAKTYAEDNLFAEAYTLVGLLRKDPIFPVRLQPQLDEVLAFTFYKQQQWDSTAFYLRRALKNASNKTELARWEYLLGQLYSLLKQPDEASAMFNKAKTHTTDPILYIHARIYEAQLVNGSNTNDPLQQTLNELLQLSRKERFDGYEDILYNAAAGIALQKQDTAQAILLYEKSNRFNQERASLKNKSFLQLAQLSYGQGNYAYAAACYDSLNLSDPNLSDLKQLEQRKTMLKKLVQHITTVQYEDSVQAVAALPEKERDAYLSKILKQLRKQKGLKEEEPYVMPVSLTSGTQAPPLFSEAGGTWYFNNPQQKAKGMNEFRARWGKRPNLDNWRRQAALDVFAGGPGAMPGNPGGDMDAMAVNDGAPDSETGELNRETLLQKLPLTEEQLTASNKRIFEALFEQGMIYKNQLEDYNQAAKVFEEIWKRFSNYEQEEATLFELYYCYQKAGNLQKSTYFQTLLQQKFSGGNYAEKIQLSKQIKAPEKDNPTKAYEKIYTHFIEGRFAEALRSKAEADSVYGNSYWTPQLLYIESLYHIRQRNDSTALVTIDQLLVSFPGTPMADKAGVLKEVLQQRKEIEDYLQNANIVRQREDAPFIPVDEGPKVNKIQPQQKADSIARLVAAPKPAQQQTQLEKPGAPLQKTGQEKSDRAAAAGIGGPGKIPVKDGPVSATKNTKVEMAYVYTPSEPYTVLMYFDKVDPVYISESRTAFQRYNNSTRSGETIKITIYEQDADELYWLEIGQYPDVASVLSYFDELKQNARQIVPWLPASKYDFIIISERNLEMLKSRKNISEYKLFIGQYIKDKF